ncbi:MAG: hypothetical protein MJ252_12345 [archaeon]|nr:hypothetical protein [archaeon]
MKIQMKIFLIVLSIVLSSSYKNFGADNKCQSYEYFDGNECKSCPVECTACTGPKNCTACLPSFGVVNGECQLCENSLCDNCPNQVCSKVRNIFN